MRIIIFVVLFLLICPKIIFGQAQLVQNFIEQNIVGNTSFGFSVSDAGDVNNDGFDDLIIGAHGYNSLAGRAYIFFGNNPMDYEADIIISGENTNDYFGYSVSGAGDVNNDGYDDVVVGAYQYNSYTGRAYIYLGGSSMDNIADVILTGESTNSYFGKSVSNAGDLNNDGFDDLIIGAEEYNSATGRAYIYFGGNSMDNNIDITLDGEGTVNLFGNSVSSAGDVNGDNFDDVIVGAYRYNSSTGRAYLFFGGNSMDNSADITMTGESTNNWFGISVSDAGDLNNDGFADVIVGANNYSSTGRAYIYYGASVMDNGEDLILDDGQPNGFGISVSSAGDLNNDGFSDVIVGASIDNLSTGLAHIYLGANSMDNTADITLIGESTSNRFGYSVTKAGDVNNDGYTDVLIGAYQYSTNSGRAYIFHGGSSMDNNSDIVFSGEGTVNNFGISVSGAGDINNDGFNDIIIGAEGYNSYTGRAYIYLGGNSIDNSVDLILTGEDTGNRFGSSVSSAGDVNNDGYDDIIVGAYAYNSATGRAYLFLGGSSINNTADIIFTGESTSNYFGTSVSGAGDVNNDEYDDIIIGAPLYNSLTGRTYIYFGGSSMNNVADLILDGDAADDEFGYSVSDAGDVNNDGYDDVIIGAYGYSSNRGRVYIYFGGNPMDTSYDVYLAGTTNSYFGFSVSSAGDVNNDNYDDVIIGAYGTNSNTGRAYIYQGGNPMNSVSDLTLNGENTGNRFGYSVSGAGDINNDGFSDVVVGAYSHNLMGKAYLFFGAGSMDNAADLTISGESNNNHFGFSVSEAGDVNGDGYNDIIIGASGYPVNGKAYVYSDPLAPLAVELTYFEGTKSQEGISLSWETATESNNFGFEIQRFQVQLVDVINLQSNEFVRIGFINGNGNSNSPKQYSFVDKSAIAGKVYIYRLKQIDFDGNYEYSDIIHVELNNLPTKFSLSQNYPNPFNPSTSIEYSIPSSEYINLKVYDILGNEVAELVNERKEAGIYKINFNASALTSGIYIYKLQAGSFIETKKLMVLK